MMDNVDTGIGRVKENLSLSLSRIRRWPEFGVILAFSTIFMVFSLLAPKFVTLRNLTGVFTIVSELGIITIGVAFLMIAGEFDLSVSSVYALSGFLFVTLANSFNSLLALIITLVAAACIGFLNGTITLRAGIPSFITTLGTMMFLRGIMLAVTGGRSVVYNGDLIVPTMLTRFIGRGFRPSHIWFLALALFFSLILTRTRYGNWVFATGGKKEVARAMGVNVNRVKVVNFMISSVMAGLAGCIVINRFGVANASFGMGMELEAIASAVIGGTFLMGGYGTIIGAFFGAFLMGMMRTGLVMVGAPAYWYQAFVGAILVIAATINIKLRRLEM
ncbi:ABC transporter permease [Candidatus Aerophobetes bacterium Ae_b3b]|nr:MAG: ABC transporter permease [Candidatus Aerophobetes bacterium Ae_b3b]